jgi:hypothetical protein
MNFKIRWKKMGAHIHCRLFVAKSPNMTYAGCGDFFIREEELPSLEMAMSGVAFYETEDVAA